MLNKKQKISTNAKIELSNSLPERLLGILQDQETVLKEENKKITQDTTSTIEHDFKFTKKYLAKYVDNSKEVFKKKQKAKGVILIILSYNEPFIISVVPILNAIIAGNTVVVKPSGKCVDFFKKIWSDSGLIEELRLPIEILERPDELEIKVTISQVDCVYFFGSFETAKKIYSLCADLFVEFVPEIETADCKVFKFNNPSDDFLNQDCETTLLQSFTHAGQTCQRISGVFVHENNFVAYHKKIVTSFNKLTKQGMEKLVANNFIVNEVYQQNIFEDMFTSHPSAIIEYKNYLPKIVIGPDVSSEFVKNGYFYPVLWLVPFKDFDRLCTALNNRRFYLGLNIHSDDQLFIDSLIESTKFTRYTVNTTHANVRLNEGWGGRWPSGSGGYKSWIEHFSIPFDTIE